MFKVAEGSVGKASSGFAKPQFSKQFGETGKTGSEEARSRGARDKTPYGNLGEKSRARQENNTTLKAEISRGLCPGTRAS